MKKKLDRMTTFLINISSVILILIAAVMVINIILRSTINYSIGGTMEIVQYGMLICIVLALSRTGFLNRHIAVTVLVDTFPKKLKAAFQAVTFLISAFAFGCLVYFAAKAIPTTYTDGLLTDIYRLPYYLVYVVLALGMLSATLMFIYQIYNSLEPFFKKNKDDAGNA